jgi:hypothetical protein
MPEQVESKHFLALGNLQSALYAVPNILVSEVSGRNDPQTEGLNPGRSLGSERDDSGGAGPGTGGAEEEDAALAA